MALRSSRGLQKKISEHLVLTLGGPSTQIRKASQRREGRAPWAAPGPQPLPLPQAAAWHSAGKKKKKKTFPRP